MTRKSRSSRKKNHKKLKSRGHSKHSKSTRFLFRASQQPTREELWINMNNGDLVAFAQVMRILLREILEVCKSREVASPVNFLPPRPHQYGADPERIDKIRRNAERIGRCVTKPVVAKALRDLEAGQRQLPVEVWSQRPTPGQSPLPSVQVMSFYATTIIALCKDTQLGPPDAWFAFVSLITNNLVDLYSGLQETAVLL